MSTLGSYRPVLKCLPPHTVTCRQWQRWRTSPGLYYPRVARRARRLPSSWRRDHPPGGPSWLQLLCPTSVHRFFLFASAGLPDAFDYSRFAEQLAPRSTIRPLVVAAATPEASLEVRSSCCGRSYQRTSCGRLWRHTPVDVESTLDKQKGSTGPACCCCSGQPVYARRCARTAVARLPHWRCSRRHRHARCSTEARQAAHRGNGSSSRYLAAQRRRSRAQQRLQL